MTKNENQPGPNITVAAMMLPQMFGISDEDMTKAQILARLGQLGGEVAQDDDLVYEGKKFVLPEVFKGNLQGAAKYLTDLDEQLNTTHAFPRTFRYRPNDVAHALSKALKKVFGTTGLGKDTVSFFGRTPPTFVTINTGLNETAQVVQGETKFPPLDAVIHVGWDNDPEVGTLGKVTIKAPRRYRAQVEGLFFAIEEELKTGSIYRGKAIDGADDPHFLNVSSVDPARVIYTQEVVTQLEANIWSLLRHTQVMRDMKLPLKRSVLIEGPYGTGKSLAAMLTAQIAVENEWTFVQVRPTDDLEKAMKTAQLYAPAVVFFEDIDGVAEKGDPQEVSRLLDLFDGITSKGTDVIAVMTTNFVERIQKGMLRPGRMDAVIHIAEMDAAGFERLIKATVPEGLLYDIDYVKVAEAYDGFLPAFAKEATDRALRYGIARTGGDPMFLTTEDFVAAAEGLRPQLQLMVEAGEGARTPDLEKSFQRAMLRAIHGVDMVDVEYGDENYETSSPDLRARVKKEALNS